LHGIVSERRESENGSGVDELAENGGTEGN